MFSFEEHVCLFDILFRLEWHDWRARAVYCMVQSYALCRVKRGDKRSKTGFSIFKHNAYIIFEILALFKKKMQLLDLIYFYLGGGDRSGDKLCYQIQCQCTYRANNKSLHGPHMLRPHFQQVLFHSPPFFPNRSLLHSSPLTSAPPCALILFPLLTSPTL